MEKTGVPRLWCHLSNLNSPKHLRVPWGQDAKKSKARPECLEARPGRAKIKGRARQIQMAVSVTATSPELAAGQCETRCIQLAQAALDGSTAADKAIGQAL
jgi:hypothetical protein